MVITLEVDLKPISGMSHYLVNILLLTHILNIYTACRVGGGLPYHESTTNPSILLQCMAYIDIRHCRGTAMDASEYARIADLLRQICLKLDKNCNPITPAGAMAVNVLDTRLDSVVRALDHCAWLDDKGLF